MDFNSFIATLVVKYRDNKLMRFLFVKPHRYYQNKRLENFRKKEKKAFKRGALETLTALDKCLKEAGVDYSLATGTLLGAIREKGFIPHDIDIDIFVWNEDYSNKLIETMANHGFKIQYSFSVDGGKLGREDSFRYKGVQVDIFYVYSPHGELPYFTDYTTFEDAPSRELSVKKHGGLKPRKISMPIIREFKTVPFENLSLPVVTNAEEVLQSRYGKDFMTPKPEWSPADSNPYVVEMEDKIGVFTDYTK